MAQKLSNSVRIIAGQYRRRLLHFPAITDLRPTPNMVRETLFNWLGQDLNSQTCLDLFAGSGALGFEAASRGAQRVVLVEREAKALHALRENRKMLAAEKIIDIQFVDAFLYLKKSSELFDLIFVDPPFALNLLPDILPLLSSHMSENARVYVEAATFPSFDGWDVIRQSNSGMVNYALLARCAS